MNQKNLYNAKSEASSSMQMPKPVFSWDFPDHESTELTLATEGNMGAAELFKGGIEYFPHESTEIVTIPESIRGIKTGGELAYGRDDSESVCGVDERRHIKNTMVYPWSIHAQVISTWPTGIKTLGTAFFFSPNRLGTSAHNLYNKEQKGWACEIKVVPGSNGKYHPFKSIKTDKYFVPDVYTKERAPKYDYGVIILPNNIPGTLTGYLGLKVLEDGELDESLVNITGYPGDKPSGQQYYGYGKITKVDQDLLYYEIDTYGGQSGSAVYHISNNKRYAVGIHGYGGCPNKAVRITKEVIRFLLLSEDSYRNIKGRK